MDFYFATDDGGKCVGVTRGPIRSAPAAWVYGSEGCAANIHELLTSLRLIAETVAVRVEEQSKKGD